jgi:hypothetical protein
VGRAQDHIPLLPVLNATVHYSALFMVITSASLIVFVGTVWLSTMDKECGFGLCMFSIDEKCTDPIIDNPEEECDWCRTKEEYNKIKDTYVDGNLSF